MERVARHPLFQLALVAPLYFLPSAIGRESDPPEAPPHQAEVEVVGRTNFLLGPRRDAKVIQAVASGERLVLIDPDEHDGYYRVIRLNKGPVGWIDSAAVSLVTERRESRTHNTCAKSLDACPVQGCAGPDEPEGIVNALKRRTPNPQLPLQLKLEEFRTLQRLADERVGQGYPGLDRTQRAQLESLKVAGRTISEGRVVRTFGYIAKGGEGLHINGEGESVNCNLKGPAVNDLRIPLVATAGDSEFKSVLVDMIPQERPRSWTLDALKTVQENGYQVWVEGQLFYDKTHFVSDDPANPLSTDANRLSLWEIHPVTRFMVCKKKHCTPGNEVEWERL